MTNAASSLCRRRVLAVCLAAPATLAHAYTPDWRNHFKSLSAGAILADTFERRLHFWSEDGTILREYPTSVPATDQLTRRGRTSVTRMVEGPSWSPTPSMLARDPDLPRHMGPGPDNPMGSHALYLSWPYYRIHGTHDPRKIGRRASHGCIGLYNDDIKELYAMCQIGTQVLLL